MMVINGVRVKAGEVVRGVGRPAPVQAEEVTLGEHWCHSVVAGLPEMTWDTFQARMMDHHGLTVLYRSMQDDPTVPDEGDLSLALWEPQNPFISDKAFLLALGEDEDGPFAVWGRPA